jgi:c-di-GMP-binding flagellar brake protein YcgR
MTMNKKRRHKRVPISAAVTITCQDGRCGPIHAMAANVSLSGIGLYADDSLEPETEVSVVMHFISADGMLRTDSLDGSVVYVKEIGGMHFMGIELREEINPAGQPFLYAHLLSVLTAD